MYQSIAISFEVIKSYMNNHPASWLDAIRLLSKEKEILVKDNFFRDFEMAVDKMGQKQLAALITHTFYIVENKIKKVDSADSSLPIRIRDNNNQSLLMLVDKTEDKILITDDENLELMVAFNHPEFEINFCSGDNYIKPEKNDVVANPRRISLVKDEEVDPSKVIFPYTKMAKEIIIRDPYPPIDRSNQPYSIWTDFLNSCNPNVRIKFITVSDRARGTMMGIVHYSEKNIRDGLLQPVTNSQSIEIIFNEEKFNDRTIETEHFNIDIGHGLGMFQYDYHEDKYFNRAGDGAYINIVSRN